LHVRSLGFRTDLMIRALEGSHIEDRDEYLVIRTPDNPTYWWGNFLLLAGPPAVGEVRKWLATFATEFPAAKHIALGIDVTELGTFDVDELVAEGLRGERSAVLTARDVHDPPRPNTAVTCRPLTGDEDWAHALALRTAVSEGEPGWSREFVERRIASERRLTEAGHGWWFGAFLDGELLGQLGLITDGSGIARYQNVETHRRARHKGVAGTLVWRAAQHVLAEDAADTLVMVADPDNVAISVYRSVGFADAETQLAFERQP